MKPSSYRNNIKKLVTKRRKWSREYDATLSLRLNNPRQYFVLQGASQYTIIIKAIDGLFIFFRKTSKKAADDLAMFIHKNEPTIDNVSDGTLVFYSYDEGIIHNEQLHNNICNLPLSPTLFKHIKYHIYKYLRQRDMKLSMIKHIPIVNRLRQIGGKDDRSK